MDRLEILKLRTVLNEKTNWATSSITRLPRRMLAGGALRWTVLSTRIHEWVGQQKIQAALSPRARVKTSSAPMFRSIMSAMTMRRPNRSACAWPACIRAMTTEEIGQIAASGDELSDAAVKRSKRRWRSATSRSRSRHPAAEDVVELNEPLHCASFRDLPEALLGRVVWSRRDSGSIWPTTT